MADQDSPPPHAADQAVLDYLDDLLTPASESVASVSADKVTAHSPAKVDQDTRSIGSKGGGLQEPMPKQCTSNNDSQSPRPAWADKDFECLLFAVAGLKLCVPLVSLGGVHRLSAELTPLFGMPAWFLGLYPSGEVNLKVVDTARWIMPERYSPDWLNSLKFLICLDNSEWALACSEVSAVMTLQPQQVKWRSQRSQRAWLAGTVMSQMCALIDIDGLLGKLVCHEPKKNP